LGLNNDIATEEGLCLVDKIPHKEVSIEKAVQNWIQVETNKFWFPGGSAIYFADAYIADIAKLIPLSDVNIRMPVDTGCRVRKE
jgi:hypothetical protein